MEKFIYDKTLRELFSEIPTTLVELITNKKMKELLNVSFPKVEERQVDLLAKMEDNTIFHLEIQSINDNKMPIRMLKYALLIFENYGQFPLQVVLYVGRDKIKINNKIENKNLF